MESMDSALTCCMPATNHDTCRALTHNQVCAAVHTRISKRFFGPSRKKHGCRSISSNSNGNSRAAGAAAAVFERGCHVEALGRKHARRFRWVHAAQFQRQRVEVWAARRLLQTISGCHQRGRCPRPVANKTATLGCCGPPAADFPCGTPSISSRVGSLLYPPDGSADTCAHS